LSASSCFFYNAFEMSNDSAKTLEALRVAQAELSSGDTSGSVFRQFSPGAAMFLTDRSVTQEKVASEIRAIVLGEDLDEQKTTK
jgi:hypothetical protein